MKGDSSEVSSLKQTTTRLKSCRLSSRLDHLSSRKQEASFELDPRGGTLLKKL